MIITEAPNDYGDGPYPVTFKAGEKDACTMIPIVDDNNPEDEEDFKLVIDPPDNLPELQVGPMNEVNITIKDDGK